jgi:beta-glucanase (GH16 family)
MIRIVALMTTTFALLSAFAGPASAAPSASAAVSATAQLATAEAKPWQCGTPKRKPDGTKWVCRFVDHFSGSSIDRTSWTVQQSSNSAAKPGQACWEDDPDNVRVSGGSLYLTVRKESQSFVCDSPWGDFTTQYTGGSVSTWNKLEQTFGRYEVRAKFPTATVSGIHSAIWLYPRDMTYGAWPRSGEIDIAEYYTRYPDRAIPYVHYLEASTADPVTNTQCMVFNPRVFNTYLVEWTPGLITIDYNGRRCLTHRIDAADPLTGSAPFDKPFFLILTQTLGIGQNPFSPTTTPLPQTMEVDRVRVWR